MTDRIGWLGTGGMGTAMGERLLATGTPLVVWNRTAARAAALVEGGAEAVATVADLAGAADIVFTMVTGSDDVIEVVTALAAAEVRPAAIVDCSTTSIEASAQARAVAAAAGIEFLAAPISGDPAMVRAGLGAFACSGPPGTFDRARPYLERMAPTVVHCGEAEEARLVKLCSNLLLGILGQAMAEATALAERGGVPPERFVEFLDGSVIASTYVRHKGRNLAAGTSMPEAARTALRRDFDTVHGAATAWEQPMPVSRVVRDLI
jgi:3-hydroxyisobutyrate dehydrogenase-like beta-hydroxyacid dehydrogenase